jgi:hypothetical protein
MMADTISRVVMLVHPLYSLYHSRASDLPADLKVDLARSRKNISFLLGVWGERIKRASTDSGTLVIVVKYDPIRDTRDLTMVLPWKDLSFQNELRWTRSRLDRFYQWVESYMGSRVVFSEGAVRPRMVSSELKRRGLHLSTGWKGEAFGEYLHRCVHHESKVSLRSWIDWRASNPMRVKHSLSLEPLNAHPLERGGLGSMRSNLPLNSRRIVQKRRNRFGKK